MDSVSNGEWTWPVETVKPYASIRKIKGGRGGARKRTCPECQYIAHVDPVSFLPCQGCLCAGMRCGDLCTPTFSHTRVRACTHAHARTHSHTPTHMHR